MEHKTSPPDIISSMPDTVVTNILNRMPLQYAVRTGVLARNWRFKWTLLSELVFNDNFLDYLIKTGGELNYGRIISRLLLHLKGTITKFDLCIDEMSKLDDEAINHWILFLSTKGIKDLTIKKKDIGTPLKLPTHLFSCLELKHLKLHNCYFNPPPSFNGFPNLLSMELRRARFDSNSLGEFLTRCPLLKTVNLTVLYAEGSVILVEIAKLENLKVLIFFDTKGTISFCSIFELLDSLPKLQVLCLGFKDFKDSDPIPEIRYNTTLLQGVMFFSFEGSENEVCLIKYLLACSPFLKTIAITLVSRLTPDERLMFAKKLLKLHRASPVAEIVLY